ncbi:HK97 family phage portal protein [Sphingomonas prati]|uniref:HK97 family phage portal protein n=1 Tax=Sphingomonas prati TaxID=1843237 RepID=A0A7W9BQI0_9SPHN|nr:phage portal protein [Sphingomonas prati]MBB5728278.1 HK97 family phage portal protein [Sphingomonas prati]
MAMRNSVFFRATSLIAGSMGMLPLSLFRRAPDGTTSKATDHRLYQTLKLDPNGFQSPSEFKSYMQLAAVLDGNAFAQVVRLNGEVQALVPYDRGTVTKERRGATLRFKHTPKSGGTTYLDPQDVFHFRAPVSLDGLNGLGLLNVAADTIGLAHLADRAMSKLLRSGVMAGGALQAKEALSDDAYARLKADMREQYSGADNAGEWMVLEEGLEAKPFSGSARDTQFVELMKRQAEEGSRFTGVPPPPAHVRRDGLGQRHRAARPLLRRLLPLAVVRDLGRGRVAAAVGQRETRPQRHHALRQVQRARAAARLDEGSGRGDGTRAGLRRRASLGHAERSA